MAQPHPFFMLLLLLVNTGNKHAFATSEFNKPVQEAYAKILKLQVVGGRDLIQKQLKENPNNACALLVENYADFFSILVSQDEAVYKKLLPLQENRLAKLEKLTEKTPYKKYAQAEIKLQIAMGQVFFADEVKAAWNVRGAYLLFAQNQKLYPDFIPNRKSLGLLQTIIGSVPDSYQWVFSILGMKGDIKTGLQNLESAMVNPNPFQKEALIYLQFARDWINKSDKKGPEVIKKLAAENPDNLLYTYLAMSMLKKNKQCDEALLLYRKRPIRNQYLPFAYLHHLTADMLLYKGDYSGSLRENEYFLKHYTGKHYLKDAYFKLYLASRLTGNILTSQVYYNQIKQKGQAIVEEDKHAQKYVETQEKFNPYLVKARLHADGGYYQEALETLNFYKPESATTQREKIEYFYRKARIFQGLDKTDSARSFYEKTILISGSLPYYFAANAALQLGYLALERNDKTTARNYFKKALSYPKHEYKNSIDSKAKVALAALRE